MARTLATLLASLLLIAAFPAYAASIVVHAPSSYGSYGRPDVYDLSTTGDFQGRFYAPFDVGDLAWRPGEILAGHGNSGTIARLDSRGGLLGTIQTSVQGVGGVAAASNGDLFVADSSRNELLRFDPNGGFLDMVFLEQRVTSLGIDGSDRLVFAVSTNPGSFNSNQDIVIYDFEQGVQSRFSTSFRSVLGLDVLGGEILVIGSGSSSSSSTADLITRFDFAGAELGTIRGPSGMRSLTAHVPEPGTALLLGVGMTLLGHRRRRLHRTG